MASLALGLWAVAWTVYLTHHGGGSWHFFSTGGQVLADLDDGTRAGLHVYAEHPVLQIGPVALGIAWGLGQVSGGNGLVAAEVTGLLAGALVALLGVRLHTRLQRARGASASPHSDLLVLMAIACFTPVWLYAAISAAHLDDILALTFCVVGVVLVVEDRPVWAGLALALATDCKPWALPLVVVLLALSSRRDRATALVTAALGIAAGWLPFFVADPHTVRALHYTIVSSPLSGLHLFDPGALRTPTWDRPLQTVLGAGLAGAAVWRRRPTGAVLLVMASRLALDPGAHRYYTAGLAAGALLWDLTGPQHSWPRWSLAVLVGLHYARWVPALNPLHAPALVVFAVLAVVAVLGPSRGATLVRDQLRPLVARFRARQVTRSWNRLPSRTRPDRHT
ncbi:glycosyltransferase 87 family protein [Knoellia sp. Soil729]|uniref:glycosyltransferase 87 family protein n=1 Tax=Knoellia sp. Soil729 TaxID=1736394 RepID=UPI0006F90D0F|nr:glycosyltransferase 87 family protein [Knoellia sp. Soil729]KRE41577.1 hypothetical protein ASG74_13740 [Knoellia sp. Soil729]